MRGETGVYGWRVLLRSGRHQADTKVMTQGDRRGHPGDDSVRQGTPGDDLGESNQGTPW